MVNLPRGHRDRSPLLLFSLSTAVSLNGSGRVRTERGHKQDSRAKSGDDEETRMTNQIVRRGSSSSHSQGTSPHALTRIRVLLGLKSKTYLTNRLLCFGSGSGRSTHQPKIPRKFPRVGRVASCHASSGRDRSPITKLSLTGKGERTRLNSIRGQEKTQREK